MAGADRPGAGRFLLRLAVLGPLRELVLPPPFARAAGQEPVGYQVGASDRIVPAWQHLQVGDIIADGPPGTAYYVVRHLEPGRALVLFTDTHLRYLLPARLRDNPRLGIFGELSDSTVLTEPEPGRTRVVRRMRMRCGPWPFRTFVVPIVLVWGEAITARNLLRGVKRRAEAPDRGPGLAACGPLALREEPPQDLCCTPGAAPVDGRRQPSWLEWWWSGPAPA